MIYPSIDKLLNVVSSKYELVHIAAKRSRHITKTNFLQMPVKKYKSNNILDYFSIFGTIIL